MSQWIEANLVNDRTLELMLRTVIADDPLALPQKIVGDKDSATNAFQRATKGCQRMRIKLTAKYNLEFPAFDAI